MGVVNKALHAVPTSHEIWVAAARLLEQEALRLPEENFKMVEDAPAKPAKMEEQRNKEFMYKKLLGYRIRI